MAGGIRFTARTFRGGGTTFEDALINAARPAIRAASEATGQEAQRNIVANASSDYNTGSESSRRRGIPSIADPGQYPYRVNTSPTGAQLVFSVAGPAAFKGKFGALNFGSGSYVIEPRGRPQLGNELDGFIVGRGSNVEHPGHAGTHFYERGIQQAVDNFSSHL